MSNYPDGAYADVMSHTEGYHTGCPSEDGRVFFCPGDGRLGHYFMADYPVTRGANWCDYHAWPCRRAWACVCSELDHNETPPEWAEERDR